MRFLKDMLARNMMKPERGVFGFFATRIFKKKNTFLEQNAVELCELSPDMKVLEVGFGPGLGLEAAFQRIQGGSGVVYGIDISDYMVDLASKRLQKECSSGKMRLFMASAYNIPCDNDFFDRIFHCNVYQFLRYQDRAAAELYRVLHSGGVMVSTLNLASLRLSRRRGLQSYGNIDPLPYMLHLENAGFKDVHIEYRQDTESGTNYQAIFSRKP